MYIYLLDLGGCIKIGQTSDFETRLKAYSIPIQKKSVKVPWSESQCAYIELLTCRRFNSMTEYMYNEKFDEVFSYVESIVANAEFTPLTVIEDELCVTQTNDGLIIMKDVVDYVNEVREKKGRALVSFTQYKNNSATRDLVETVRNKTGKAAIITKAGGQGGSYADPIIMFDFLMSSDKTIYVKMMSAAMSGHNGAEGLMEAMGLRVHQVEDA